MVTDEMIEKAVTEMARQDITFAHCDSTWQKRTIRAALEAALSAAEPIATVAEMGAGVMRVLMPHPPGSADHLPIGTKLYAAPPAPSVAVKALQAAEEELSRIDCVPMVTETRDTYAQLELAKVYAGRGAHEARKALSALSAQVQDVADLDTRMKAAGMYTVAEMMGVTPLTKWKSNPAINTIEAFSEWLDRKVSEYLSMKAGYDLGDKREDDDLYEWVLAHAGVFSTIRDQFQVVTAAPRSQTGRGRMSDWWQAPNYDDLCLIADSRNEIIKDNEAEITSLRTQLSEAKKIAVNAEGYGYGHGLEVAAQLAKKMQDDALTDSAREHAGHFEEAIREIQSPAAPAKQEGGHD